VDTSLGPKREGAIRVEEQTRSRLVGGKRYGRFAAESKEQFAWINVLAQPVETLVEARKPRLEVAR